jgi:cytochrome c oxidase subunit 1
MSSESTLHGHEGVISTSVHEAHEVHHHHHHEESFISKYVFSQDHKMIAKQFLITGMVWAVIGGLFSVIFRLQLGYPEMTFPVLEDIFGKWAAGGRISNDFYYSLVTMHGTILVFFVLTAGLSGTFANLLIPLQIGARDMASPMLNMLSYWFFLSRQYHYVLFIIYPDRPCKWRLDDISSIKCTWPGHRWLETGNGFLAGIYGNVYRVLIAWRP